SFPDASMLIAASNSPPIWAIRPPATPISAMPPSTMVPPRMARSSRDTSTMPEYMRRSTYFLQFPVPLGAVPSFESLGAAEVVEQTATAVRLQAGSAAVEITALADDLFRVGMFGAGRPREYRSEGVARVDWATVAARVAVEADEVRIETPRAT